MLTIKEIENLGGELARLKVLYIPSRIGVDASPGEVARELEARTEIAYLEKWFHALTQSPQSARLKARLTQHMKTRWEAVRQDGMSYLDDPKSPMNSFYWSLAHAMGSHEEAWGWLMPSLNEAQQLPSGYQRHELLPSDFIISDDGTELIEVAFTLERYRDTGRLEHVSMGADGKHYVRKLSESERMKLASHDEATRKAYQAIKAADDFKRHGDSLGMRLERLADKMFDASVAGSGSEAKAEDFDPVELLEFKKNTLEMLTPETQRYLKEHGFYKIWDDIISLKGGVETCCKINSGRVGTFLQQNPGLYALMLGDEQKSEVTRQKLEETCQKELDNFQFSHRVDQADRKLEDILFKKNSPNVSGVRLKVLIEDLAEDDESAVNEVIARLGAESLLDLATTIDPFTGIEYLSNSRNKSLLTKLFQCSSTMRWALRSVETEQLDRMLAEIDLVDEESARLIFLNLISEDAPDWAIANVINRIGVKRALDYFKLNLNARVDEQLIKIITACGKADVSVDTSEIKEFLDKIKMRHSSESVGLVVEWVKSRIKSNAANGFVLEESGDAYLKTMLDRGIGPLNELIHNGPLMGGPLERNLVNLLVKKEHVCYALDDYLECETLERCVSLLEICHDNLFLTESEVEEKLKKFLPKFDAEQIKYQGIKNDFAAKVIFEKCLASPEFACSISTEWILNNLFPRLVAVPGLESNLNPERSYELQGRAMSWLIAWISAADLNEIVHLTNHNRWLSLAVFQLAETDVSLKNRLGRSWYVENVPKYRDLNCYSNAADKAFTILYKKGDRDIRRRMLTDVLSGVGTRAILANNPYLVEEINNSIEDLQEEFTKFFQKQIINSTPNEFLQLLRSLSGVAQELGVLCSFQQYDDATIRKLATGESLPFPVDESFDNATGELLINYIKLCKPELLVFAIYNDMSCTKFSIRRLLWLLDNLDDNGQARLINALTYSDNGHPSIFEAFAKSDSFITQFYSEGQFNWNEFNKLFKARLTENTYQSLINVLPGSFFLSHVDDYLSASSAYNPICTLPPKKQFELIFSNASLDKIGKAYFVKPGGSLSKLITSEDDLEKLSQGILAYLKMHALNQQELQPKVKAIVEAFERPESERSATEAMSELLLTHTKSQKNNRLFSRHTKSTDFSVSLKQMLIEYEVLSKHVSLLNFDEQVAR